MIGQEPVPGRSDAFRWEWRAFGKSFGDAEDRLGANPVERVDESDEVYLLSRTSDASVKVRAGLMDVKLLQSVNEEGLEQWKPVIKASFPLPAAEVGAVFDALGTAAPATKRIEYTLDKLLDELVESNEDLLAVNVRKRRAHYTVGGCMAELTDVRTDRGATRTIAVESEDPSLVIAVVRELGLAARGNVNVARGLKALVGFGAHRFAVIDVGTNSVKFLIGERAADGVWTTIVDRADVTRLGEGLDESGHLGDEPIERTVRAIAAMADEARRDKAEAIAAVGTAGLRAAPNRDTLVEAARRTAGVDVEVITGEEEGRLAYLAVKAAHGSQDRPLVVFDSGGGSSQFTFGHGDVVDEQFSVDVGSARFTERYRLDEATSEETLSLAMNAIAADLARLDGRPVPDVLVGMGGAVTNLAAVEHGLATYDSNVVQGSILSRTEIDRQIELYRTRSADQRREIVGLQPKRAEVILAGACIVRTVLEKLGRDELTVSDRGLRHGLLVDRFGK
jgi:exopolyphosphatase/guanosine-5'-triphosphate,3'-diphosphate pyrophosphatase